MIDHDPLRQMLVDIARQADARDALKVDRERAEEDPNYFMEQILDFKQAPIHEMIQDHLSAYDRAVIHAPTYFGKSTQVSVGRPLYELCRNQDSKTIISSASFERKLKPLFGSLKATMMLNPKIRILWPHMRPEERQYRESLWTKTAIIVERSDRWFDETVKQEGFDPSDPSIQIGPTNGEFQGARFDFGIGDDMLPGDTAISPAVREQVWHWLWQSFVSRRSLKAKIWLIGTPHHKRDPYHRAIEEQGFVPLLHNGKNLDGLDYKHLWPERAGYVEKSRPEVPGGLPYLHFMRTVCCQPLSDAMQYFMRTVLEDNYADGALYGLDTFQERKLTAVSNICGVDLATGKKKTSKKKTETCFFCMTLADGGRFTVPYIACDTMDSCRKVLTAALILRTFPNTLFVVEDNGMQEAFVDLMRNAAYMADAGIEPMLAAALAARVQTFTTGINKQDPVSGVQGMDATFRGRRFALARRVPEIQRWFDGLERYSGEDHTDDPVMAAWFAWRWWTTHAPVEYDAKNALIVPIGSDDGRGHEEYLDEFELEFAETVLEDLSL